MSSEEPVGLLAPESFDQALSTNGAPLSVQKPKEKRDIEAERREIDRKVNGKTLCTAFAETAERHGDLEALKWKTTGGWNSLTWREYHERVRDLSLGLRSYGFEAGNFCLLYSRNRPEHVIASHGAIHALGTPVSLYAALAPSQIAYIANHCEAPVAVIEDAAFLDKLLAVRSELPHLRLVVLMEEVERAPADWVTHYDDVLAAGRREHERDPNTFDRNSATVRPEDLAALIYTSGTSGPPKGVMITHRNALYEVEAFGRLVRAQAGDRLVSFLPLAHVTEHWLTLWQSIVSGTTTHFCPDITQLIPTLVDVRPTWLMAAPRVWEKFYAGLRSSLHSLPDERRHAVEDAIAVGRQILGFDQRGECLPKDLAERRRAVEQVRSGILARLGLDKCRVPLVGAAPCPVDVIEFFHALGLRISEGWGMTEVSCVGSWNGLNRIKIGTVGPTVPGLEGCIKPDGELLVRGGNVMAGYYRDPVRTAEALDEDGWLHTGDVAAVDDDGYYRIIDRKKELIITSYGKNISPVNLESLLKQLPLIGQACVVGDGRPYVAALIVLDPLTAAAWAEARGIEVESAEELATNRRLIAELKHGVDGVNEQLSEGEKIRAFKVLPSEWTVDTGELTPTFKLKRRVVISRYASHIEALYEGVMDPELLIQESSFEALGPRYE